MTVLRRLADGGKQVLVVTHDLDHLDLVDEVLVLQAGGAPAYYGPPSGVFAHFGTTSWAETFAKLAVPGPPWAVRTVSGPANPGRLPSAPRKLSHGPRAVPRGPAAPAPAHRDRPALPGAPGGNAPCPRRPAGGNRAKCRAATGPHQRRSHVAAGARRSSAVRSWASPLPSATWSGNATSRPREGRRGLRQGYLEAKVGVFFAVAILQCVLLVGVVLVSRPGPGDALVLGSPQPRARGRSRRHGTGRGGARPGDQLPGVHHRADHATTGAGDHGPDRDVRRALPIHDRGPLEVIAVAFPPGGPTPPRAPRWT